MAEKKSEGIMKINFIVIGASRSGTTYIHDNLDAHPEIFVTKEPSEPHFFNKYYEKGLDYYFSLFSQVKDQKAVGDVTPDYIFHTEAAKRIAKDLPDVKIIATLRNPVDRLYSMYWILRDKFEENKSYSFEEIIEVRPDLIEQGYFVDFLKPYFELFEKENILILQFEEIKSNGSKYLKRIYDFIGADGSFYSPYTETRINRAKFLKHESRLKFLFYLWRFAKKFGFKSLAYSIEKFNSSPTPPMNPETRKKLLGIFETKNRELEELTGLDFSHWNN